jgi:hypothetical protein
LSSSWLINEPRSGRPKYCTGGWYCREMSLKDFSAWSFFTVFTAGDRLCGPVVRVPGYRTEIYCISCEVRTKFIYIM